MVARAIWKGFLKVGELSCPVALHAAVSTSERIAFHLLNRETGHRLNREFVDSETGDTIDRDAQVKGYEVAEGDYVILEPEDIAAAVPQGDKVLDARTFISCSDIDDIYFDRPYYLSPSDRSSQEVFALIRDGLTATKAAAIAETVLFRRARTLLIRTHHGGLIANTLNYEYEVRSAEAAFEDLPDLELKGEMLELASHIIGTKMGTFDPGRFDDRYEAALAELVKAKIEGRRIERKPEPKETRPTDLLEALRLSAGSARGKATGARKAKPASARRLPKAS